MATVTRKLGPTLSPGDFSKLGTESWSWVSAWLMPPSAPLASVAQKVVTLRKQQQLLAACKSLPSSPSHSAASTPVAGQVSWGFRVHRGAGKNQKRGWWSKDRNRVPKEVGGQGAVDGKGSDTICRKCIGLEISRFETSFAVSLSKFT